MVTTQEMQMTRNRNKLIAILIFSIFIFGIMISRNEPVRAIAATAVDDPAAVYKAKCAACHTPKADKFYDPARPEEEQIQAVLKGKKGEKPPYMPGFESKGMTAEEAKALVTYMKSLRTPAN
jgi:mono/diheme cytochrome c family protein